MEKTGVLSMEIVDHVFSKFCQERFAKENILHLMEQFGLIAKYAFPIHDVKYFVPAQLRLPPGQCHLKPALTDPCPLYLQFSIWICSTRAFYATCIALYQLVFQN